MPLCTALVTGRDPHTWVCHSYWLLILMEMRGAGECPEEIWSLGPSADALCRGTERPGLIWLFFLSGTEAQCSIGVA